MSTLNEICEPVFQYVCRLNRLGRKGGRTDTGIVRTEIRQIFGDMRQRAEATPGMVGPYDRIEKVLMYFVDSVILNSQLNFAGGWKPFSADPRQLGINETPNLGFEETFWDILDETLRDPSEQGTQCLGVFYECIGLGFTGLFADQPEYRRRKMLEISARLRAMVDADLSTQICPEAYQNVDTRNLNLSPTRRLTGWVLAMTVLCISVFGGYIYLFHKSRQDLEKATAKLKGPDPTVVMPASTDGGA